MVKMYDGKKGLIVKDRVAGKIARLCPLLVGPNLVVNFFEIVTMQWIGEGSLLGGAIICI